MANTKRINLDISRDLELDIVPSTEIGITEQCPRCLGRPALVPVPCDAVRGIITFFGPYDPYQGTPFYMDLDCAFSLYGFRPEDVDRG